MNRLEEWAVRHGISREAMTDLRNLYVPEVKSVEGSSEARVQSEIRLAAAERRDGSKLLRNNSGAGDIDGSGRVVRWGLGNDSKELNKVYKSSDLIGPTPVLVQPHHVGRTFGVMTCIEVKESGWTKPKNEHERAQMAFLVDMANRGAIAGFAAHPADYARFIAEFVR